jgi:adenylosuccinate synthase
MNKAYIAQGTCFGDESKSGVVDLLSSKITKSHRTPPPVIRHSGGPQCGHNVEVNGKHHCFQMWGSGSFNCSDTYLLQNVLINPLNIEKERQKLAKTIGIGQKTNFWQKKMFIHEDCLVITPFHIALNRLQELKNKHGSVGSGCWTAIEFDQNYPEFSIRARDLKYYREIVLKLRAQIGEIVASNIKPLDDYQKSIQKDNFIDLLSRIDEYSTSDYIDELARVYMGFSQQYQILSEDDIKTKLSGINKTTPLIFEGNQGTLLDPDFGFAPHTTANSSTSKYAEEFCRDIALNTDEIHRIGVTRPYMTRHGNGPFPTYDPDFNTNIGNLAGERNKFGQWQGDFRVGRFDLPLLEESLIYQPVDSLFVSCLDNDPYNDYFVGDYCLPFDSLRNAINKAAEIARMLKLNLSGFSFGPDRSDKYIKI